MRAIVPFILALFISFFNGNISLAQNKTKDKKEIDYKQLKAPMPHFEIRSNDGKMLTEKDFQEYNHVVLIMFNPTCGHCIDLGKEIANDASKLKTTAVVYIAANGMDDYLKYFIDQTGLDKVLGAPIVMGVDQTPNANLGNSFSVFLAQLFEYQLPQVNIYNKERKMIFKHSGATALDDILNQLR